VSYSCCLYWLAAVMLAHGFLLGVRLASLRDCGEHSWALGWLSFVSAFFGSADLNVGCGSTSVDSRLACSEYLLTTRVHAICNRLGAVPTDSVFQLAISMLVARRQRQCWRQSVLLLLLEDLLVELAVGNAEVRLLNMVVTRGALAKASVVRILLSCELCLRFYSEVLLNSLLTCIAVLRLTRRSRYLFRLDGQLYLLR
jgi:hypothetical protein